MAVQTDVLEANPSDRLYNSASISGNHSGKISAADIAQTSKQRR